MERVEQAARWLTEHDRFLIITHRRPDGDAVGSASALCRGLRQLGKEAELFPNPEFSEKFRPLYADLLGREACGGKTVIAVDMAAETLLPYNAENIKGKIQFCADHHGSNSGYAPETWVDAHAAACGQMILSLLETLHVTIDSAMADSLYAAISTDTGCFRYSNTTAKTLEAAAKCLQYGADTKRWNRILFLEKPLSRLKLEAYLTAHTQLLRGGSVAISILPQSVMEDLGVKEEDLDDISGFPRDIAGVEIGAMIRTVRDGAKISLRTFAPYNASAICGLLGGGGHTAAAGATVPGTTEDGKKALLEALRQSGVEV